MNKITEFDLTMMSLAIEQAEQGVINNAGGPFGAIITKRKKIIAKGHNRVTSSNDPTAHAEVVAIRRACQVLHSFQLEDCVLYSSCEPCPMCLGAIYWARPKKVFYAANRHDAAAIGFDDELIYRELNLDNRQKTIPLTQIELPQAIQLFEDWRQKSDKIKY